MGDLKGSAASAAQPLGTAGDGSGVIHVQNEDELRLAQMGVFSSITTYFPALEDGNCLCLYCGKATSRN